MSDANLRTIFRSGLPTWHWQSIETWSTGQGVPDAEFCAPGGVSGWIENKKTSANVLSHPPTPEQVAWLERRSRIGGRCFIAVRKQHGGGPRLGKPVDLLYIYRGDQARNLLAGGITAARADGCWEGGPRRWPWEEIARTLVS